MPVPTVLIGPLIHRLLKESVEAEHLFVMPSSANNNERMQHTGGWTRLKKRAGENDDRACTDRFEPILDEIDSSKHQKTLMCIIFEIFRY